MKISLPWFLFISPVEISFLFTPWEHWNLLWFSILWNDEVPFCVSPPPFRVNLFCLLLLVLMLHSFQISFTLALLSPFPSLAALQLPPVSLKKEFYAERTIISLLLEDWRRVVRGKGFRVDQIQAQVLLLLMGWLEVSRHIS